MAQANSATMDSLGKQCIALFKQIYSLLDQRNRPYQDDVSADDIQDEFGRFLVWGENIGALQPGHMRSSLEFRLRDASQTRSRVQRFLIDLQESLAESMFQDLHD